MSMPIFCGLLQTDGHFSFTYENNGTYRSKIVYTQSVDNIDLLLIIQNWLIKKFNIKPTLPRLEMIDKYIAQGKSINLEVDREKANLLFNLIQKQEKELQIPLLFDKKRKDFLIVQRSTYLNQNTETRNQNSGILTDLFMEIKKGRKGPPGLSREETIQRINPDFRLEDNNMAAEEIASIDLEVENFSRNFFDTLEKQGELNNKDLNQFILGVMEGDGSFAVALEVPTEQFFKNPMVDQITKSKRFYKFEPYLSITGQKGDNNYLYKLASLLLVNNVNPVISMVEKNSNSDRLYLKDIDTLKKYALPFFKANPPFTPKSKKRFEIFATVLNNIPEVYESQKKSFELAEYIYQYHPERRQKTLQEFKIIIEKAFN